MCSPGARGKATFLHGEVCVCVFVPSMVCVHQSVLRETKREETVVSDEEEEAALRGEVAPTPPGPDPC